MSLTQDLVKELFTYKDGNLYWNHTRKGGIVSGMLAGTKTHNGYYRVRINYRNKANNKIENLRQATRAENCRNQGLSKNNTSGVKGVSWFKRDNNWSVSLRVNRKSIHLGYYNSLEEAKK